MASIQNSYRGLSICGDLRSERLWRKQTRIRRRKLCTQDLIEQPDLAREHTTAEPSTTQTNSIRSKPYRKAYGTWFWPEAWASSPSLLLAWRRVHLLMNTGLSCHLRLRVRCQPRRSKARFRHAIRHPVRDKINIRRNGPNRILVSRGRGAQQTGSRGLWRQDSWGGRLGAGRGGRIDHNSGRDRLGGDWLERLDVGACTDTGGEDLLESLLEGHFFYRFEVLDISISNWASPEAHVVNKLAYLDCLDLQLQCGVLVAYNHGVRV